MNCNQCKHVQKIPGDAHKKCVHPMLTRNPINHLLILVSATSVDGKNIIFAECPFQVVADFYGYQQGWAAFPNNFDPIWIKRCQGFEKKEVQLNG